MNLEKAIIGANLRGPLERALLEVVRGSVGSSSVVDISSAQILDGHNTSVNLIPALKASKNDPTTKYYKDYVLCFEFTQGSVPYVEGGVGVRYPQVSVLTGDDKETVVQLDDLGMVSGFPAPGDSVSFQVVKLSDVISTYGGDPSIITGLDFSTNLALVNGNGTVKCKVFTVVESVG